MARIIFNPSTGNIESANNVTSPLKTLGEKLKLTGGNPLPEDPTKPVNPWAPKPIGPVLPNKKLASLTNMNTPDLEQSPDSFLRPGETLEDWDVTFRRANAYGGLQRTGFLTAGLVKPNNRTLPKFHNKWGVRTGLTVPTNTPGYLGMSGEQAMFETEADANRFINEDADRLRIEANKNRKQSDLIEARYKKIRDFVKAGKKAGKTKIYLEDIIDHLEGEKSRWGEKITQRGIKTEQTTIDRAALRRSVEEALGPKEYNKLIKSTGGDPRIIDANRIKFNKLVRAVNRGDRPLIDLTQSKTGVAPPKFKELLNPLELKMYEKLSPKFRAILSRITQPRQVYTEDDIKNISKTTNKTFNKMLKKYPLAQVARTDIFKSGTRFFNNKSYILGQIARHIGEGGDLYRHVSGDKMSDVKFRNNQTGRLITYSNIDITDPEFKEAATRYDEWDKIKNHKIDNPLKKGEKITIAKAIAAGGDNLVIDHLDPEGVKGNPLKNLAITNQKANMAGQIKGLTQVEIDAIGRGLNLSVEDNIKRYSSYGDKLLRQSAGDPNFKKPTPSETIIKKTGTLRGKAEAIKSKMDASRMFTSRIPGGAAVLAPADFVLSMVSGVPIYDAAASAGSYLLKDPYLGKAVNIPLALRAATDYGDADEMLRKAQERTEKLESTLDKYTPEPVKNLLDFSISDYVKEKFAEGGRVGFADGTPHDDKSDEEILEWIKNQMFEMEQGWNTGKSVPGKILDVARVDNWPYYAARMLRAGMNVAEVSAKLPFVSIDLLQKLATRPAFKIKKAEPRSSASIGMGEKYMEGVDDSWLTDQPYNKLEGTGLFTEAFQNLMPGAFSEKTGLDSLIEGMEDKMIAQGQSKWPTIAGKNIEMGLDITLPFGYVMAANKYNALKKSLAPYVAGRNVDEVIEETLTDKGMNRRDFNKLLVTSGAIGALKYLGLDKLLKGATRNPIPGPIKMIERSTTKMPVWFPKFIDKVNDKMTYHGDGMWSFTGTDDFLPGFHIERIGDDYHISGKNQYEQDFNITYEAPKWEGDADGSFYNQGEFVVEDSIPINADPDGNVDFDGYKVDEVHDVLGGTREMEEIGTGKKIEGTTKGENAVIEAEVRADQAYDQWRESDDFVPDE